MKFKKTIFFLPTLENHFTLLCRRKIFWSLKVHYLDFHRIRHLWYLPDFSPYVVHINRTSFLAASTVTAALLNLLFNYLSIKSFGTIGAAYVTILAFTVSAILVFFYTSKKYPMPWRKV